MQRREFVQRTGAFVAACTGSSASAEPLPSASRFLAGVAVRSIVPDPKLVNNALHAQMTVRFDERGSPLQVKALALTHDATTRLLLAVDLVGVSTLHNRKLRAALARATGVAVENIVVCVSHSHSTPMLEPLTGPHPFWDFVFGQALEAGTAAVRSRKPATMGADRLHVVGASFNTNVPLPDGRMKFTRDFREGLATGRQIDPRLHVVRIDDATGKPMAGWVRFAAHPACVIFNAPISAEYPGYMTDRLTELSVGTPPILYGNGASGDINCIPLFGRESDSRLLGRQLAELAAPVLASIKTGTPRRFLSGQRLIALPLDPPPSAEELDREIAEIEQFIADLEKNPDLEWVIGTNCKKDWAPGMKRRYVQPLADWARKVKAKLASGYRFPGTWPLDVTVWVLDDLALVFEPSETLIGVSLDLSARSPVKETLLISHSNGETGYLGTDEDRRRRGYRTYTSQRYAQLAEDSRPLPYALGAAGRYVDEMVKLIREVVKT